MIFQTLGFWKLMISQTSFHSPWIVVFCKFTFDFLNLLISQSNFCLELWMFEKSGFYCKIGTLNMYKKNVIYLPTWHGRAQELIKTCTCIQDQIGIWSVGFCGGRKTGEHGKEPSEQEREPTTNSTHIWHRAGIEPGPHWWEAIALTTAPPLLP